jgi:hypothetical protein
MLWLALISTLVLADTVQVQTYGTGIWLDDAQYVRVPLAARLRREDYTNLPPRHSAQPVQVEDFKRLFALPEPTKVLLVKKSLAEAKPVVIAMHTPASFHRAKEVWQPAAHDYAPQEVLCQRPPCHYTMLTVVAYDDTKYGGAFEVMRSRETPRGQNGFLWIRYKDFRHFCPYAFEPIAEAPGPSSVVRFAGAVRFEHASGAIMPAHRRGRVYQLTRPYPSGTRLRIVITAAGPTYVYAFSADLTPTSYRLFPPTEDISAHLGYKQNHLVLPDEGHYLQLDNIPGTDYFCVLFAKRKLDLSAIMGRMKRTEGDFLTRLHTVLGQEFVAEVQRRFGPAGEIRFTAYGRQKWIVPLVVEIHHTAGQ